MFEIIGAEKQDGRAVCKACGCRLPENAFPGFVWAHGAFCYEEYRCPKCGQKITMVRTEAARHA